MTIPDKSRDELIAEIQQLQMRIIELEAEIIERRRSDKAYVLTDPLTELYSRRHFYNIAQREIERAVRYHIHLSLVMIGIDSFGDIIETYGRGFADRILQILSDHFQESFRGSDILGRYGDDKFTILLPETNIEQARLAAERIQRKISRTSVETRQGAIEITFCLGVASMEEELTLDRLTDRAMQALQLAQSNGSNQITLWEDTDQIGIL